MQRLDNKAESLDELSPRQRQILALLRAGKVNKEIANELQIGVGTVKQHVVALFKRLQVSNRAMAVARSGEFGHNAAQTASPTSMPADGLLQRRPCIILCVGLAEDAPATAVRHLHASLAALAFDHDALFLARKGNAGDLIFGLSKVSEYDALKALQVLQTLQAGFTDEASAATAPSLRAAMVAGLVVASMNRYGGWSGEAVASASISRGRSLLEQAAVGQLLISEQLGQLLLAFGIADASQELSSIALSQLDALRWRGERPSIGLLGRRFELAKLSAGLTEIEHRIAQRRVQLRACKTLFLCGETGMGKSLLCRQLASLCLQQEHHLSFWRAMPSVVGAPLQDVLLGNVVSLAQWLALQHGDGLLIIDDLHLLPIEEQRQIIAQAEQQCSYLVLACRRLQHKLEPGADMIQLQRLPQAEIEAMILQAWQGNLSNSANLAPHPNKKAKPKKSPLEKQNLVNVAQMAAGVPLFALELARLGARWQAGELDIGLALAVVVTARLDELALDRYLLQEVARSESGCTLADLAVAMRSKTGADASWQASIDAALAAGVLRKIGDGEFAVLQISHPLMRLAIAWLAQEQT